MLLVRDARISLERIRSIIPAYIVSTSYSQYIEALCTVLGIPKEHTFSTCLNLDAQSLSTEETRRLQALQEEILSLPSIEIPEDAERLEDLSSSSQRTIARLDTIFWEEFPKTTAGRILLEVRPVGGVEKARVVADITMTLVTSLDAVFYVGDSITDAEILRIVKDSGGVAVSFNGNRYAVEKAEISVLSDSLLAVAILAEIFAERGRDGVLELVKKETPDSFMNLMQIAQSSSTSLPEVSVITPTNLGQIARKSIAFRREVRGEAIAALG
jgi:energy-converting hydrogenase A subunit R